MKFGLIYGNFWVSAGAASLAYSTNLLLQKEASLLRISLVFFACLFVYNYHRIFRLKHIYGEKASPRHHWIIRNKWSILLLTLGSGLLSLFLFYRIANPFLLTCALPCTLIALLYVMPLFRVQGKWVRLRDVPYLKVFLIALVWAFATVILPLSDAGESLFSDPGVQITLLQRFLFILAITLPFDVRDLAHDKQFGLKTFASLLGVNRLKQLSHVLLLGMLLTVFYAMANGIYQPRHSIGLLLSALGTGWLINRLSLENSESYYAFFLDGTMVDQLFWIWLLGTVV